MSVKQAPFLIKMFCLPTVCRHAYAKEYLSLSNCMEAVFDCNLIFKILKQVITIVIPLYTEKEFTHSLGKKST